jgi:serine phosphatase RsbU (regulator of sigma subunit)
MSRIQTDTLPPSSAARRLASTDYLAAVQRFEIFSRVVGDVAEADGEESLRHKLRSALDRLFEGPRAVAYLPTPDNGSEIQATDEASASLLLALCSRIDAIPATRRSRASMAELLPYLVVPHLLPADPERGLGSIVSSPMMHGNRMLGLLVVEADPEGRELNLADMHALSAIAAQASLLAQRLRAEKRAAEQLRIEQDISLARTIQRRFLPLLSEQIAGFRVAAEYRPAYNVGGDFYDVVQTGPQEITVIVGDVSGKGISAALLMSRVSSDFRRLTQLTDSPQALLAQLNRALAGHSPDDTFATATCLRIDAERGRATVANAGHLAPLLRRRSGHVRPIGLSSGLPLGILDGETYVDETFELERGDIILLMTDGVAEALDRDLDRLGMATLRRLVSDAPGEVGEINRRVLAGVDSADRAADDLTLVALELVGSEPNGARLAP